MTDDKRSYKDEMLARMYGSNAPVTKAVETEAINKRMQG